MISISNTGILGEEEEEEEEEESWETQRWARNDIEQRSKKETEKKSTGNYCGVHCSGSTRRAQVLLHGRR
jgi:hypothetical protein